MIDWSQPHSLAKVTEDAGFTMSDVAFISGLDESTISRLWDDPHWLDRVKGRSLQALVASVPGVAEYFASHSVLTRRDRLISQLEAEGLRINHQALRLSNAQRVPHQYLINALEAALSIMQGDDARTCGLIARFWGIQQNRALEALYGPAAETSLLRNPEELVSASLELIPRLNPKTYSFHTIITKAHFAHHLGIATGEITEHLRPEITDRQSALMTRSGTMGLLISSNNTDLAQKYQRMVATTPVLSVIEEWAFPTYARDSKPNADFSLPASLLLRRTATEIIREIDSYPDAYIYYLVTTYIPLALSHDPTFGLRIQDLIKAISTRVERCGDITVRNACLMLIRQLKENQ
jgi:hypothetical protein